MRVIVHAGAAGRDARVLRDIGHLGEHQPGAADGARAVVHEVPVVRQAVLRRILAHRRHHEAVLQGQAAQAERLEHRRQRFRRFGREAERADIARHDPVDLVDECGRAQRQVVIGDRLGARHQAERKARRIHVPEPVDVLEPHQGDVGRVLRLFHFIAPPGLEARQRGGNIAVVGRTERLVERDAVLHRELGAGADGEMRRRLGVAEQHHVVGDPALAADGREIAPDRAVGDQPVALQLLGEQGFDEPRRGRLVELVEPGARKRPRIGLDDPGGALRLVLIAMGDEDAVLGLAEEEGEGIERPGRAHPGEEVRPQIDAWLEPVGKGVAHARIDAVRHHHEIGIADRRVERRDFRLVFDLDAERARAPAQDLQQRSARATAEAVAADAVGRAAKMDLDVVPIGEVADDGAIALAVVALERVERLIGEHHAEAERIVGTVALEHGDARRRPRLLHQNREIEAGRPAADHVNLHARLHRSRSRSGAC